MLQFQTQLRRKVREIQIAVSSHTASVHVTGFIGQSVVWKMCALLVIQLFLTRRINILTPVRDSVESLVLQVSGVIGDVSLWSADRAAVRCFL